MNCRAIVHRDGRLEIVRVLTEEGLTNWSDANPLDFELSIVWLHNLETLDFVRVHHVRNAQSRRGKLYLPGNHILLGYSKLTANAPQNPETRGYERRVFYLRDSDQHLNLNAVPEGGLDPRSIFPGVAGDRPQADSEQLGYLRGSRRPVEGAAV
jgi:hypothetical protein